MLKNKANRSSRTQSQKPNYASSRPSSDNQGLCTKLVFVPQLFPVGSDYVGGNSTIAAGQISRAYQTVSDETAFGKMFRFTLVGQESGVSRRGWSSPRTNNAAVSFQGKRVLGVYASDGTPVQSGKSKDVVDNDFGFGNSDAWIPEQQPGKKAKPNVDPDIYQQNGDWFGGKRKSANGRKGHGQNSHDFARAGSKQLGIHTVSFTQSAAEVGVAQ
jgi:hypothetical protein